MRNIIILRLEADRPLSVSWFPSHSAAVTLQLHLWCRPEFSVCWVVTPRLTFFQWRFIEDKLLRFLGGLILPVLLDAAFMGRWLQPLPAQLSVSAWIGFWSYQLVLKRILELHFTFWKPEKSLLPLSRTFWKQNSDRPFICIVKLVNQGCSARIRHEKKIKYAL